MIDSILLMRFKEVNWSDPSCKISTYFTVKDAIWLNEWNRLADATDGLDSAIKISLFVFFNNKADAIRMKLGRPVYTKSCYRPKKYNALVGGATNSAHMCIGTDPENKELRVVAWDFWADMDNDADKDGADCDKIKEILMPELEPMKIRLENNGKGARWAHVDTRWSNGNRFFLL
jgi:phage pi2 protein 07